MTKIIILILCAIIYGKTYSQLDNGIDSISKISWEYSVFVINEDGTPYKYVKNEYYFETDVIYYIAGDTVWVMQKTISSNNNSKALPHTMDTVLLKNIKIFDSATKKIGKWKEWGYNPYHSKSFCEYTNGEKDGKEIIYYSNEKLSGIVLEKNFRMKSTGNWSGGKKTGKWKEYYPNGNIMKIKIFKNGTLIKEKTLPNKS